MFVLEGVFFSVWFGPWGGPCRGVVTNPFPQTVRIIGSRYLEPTGVLVSIRLPFRCSRGFIVRQDSWVFDKNEKLGPAQARMRLRTFWLMLRANLSEAGFLEVSLFDTSDPGGTNPYEVVVQW